MKKIFYLLGSLIIVGAIAICSYFWFFVDNENSNNKDSDKVVSDNSALNKIENKDTKEKVKNDDNEDSKNNSIKEIDSNTNSNKATKDSSKDKNIDIQEANKAKDREISSNSKQETNVSKSLNEEIKKEDIEKSPTYVNGIIIVNKKNPLPKNYNKGENPDARRSVNKLIADMQAKGMNISNQTSGFRSYEHQVTLYNNYVASHGKQQADTFSARPGHSEHQTGLTFDLIDNQGRLLGSLGTTQSSKDSASWVEKNAHNYGFIVRYKKEFVNETGYIEEPWHLRYVGKDVATQIYNANISLERYLGVQGGDYIN